MKRNNNASCTKNTIMPNENRLDFFQINKIKKRERKWENRGQIA